MEVTKNQILFQRFLKLRALAYGFISRNLGFRFAIHKHLTKVLDFRLVHFLIKNF